MTGGRFRK